MGNSRILFLIIVLTSFLSVFQPVAAQETGQSSSTKEFDGTERARDLLDTWRGQRKVLNEAKEILDQTLKANPNNYKALKELARYYVKKGFINKKDMEVEGRILSVSQFEPGSLESAESTLKKALSIKPDYAEGYILLGHVYTKQLKFKLAREALTKAESIGTNDPWLHMNWAELLGSTGEKEAATNRCMQVIKSGTTDKALLMSAYGGLIGHHEMKPYNNANDIYKKMMEIDPKNAWLRGNYADFLRIQLGAYDESIKYAREALRIMDYGVGRQILANCLYAKSADLVINHKGTENEAQKCFDEAFQINPHLDLVMAYQGSLPNTLALVKYLITKGISVDARAEDGSTALMIASNRGRNDVVLALLSLGADPNAVAQTGWTALLGAADHGHTEVFKTLLAHGANPHQRINSWDAAALAQAKGHTKLAQFIKQYTSNATPKPLSPEIGKKD
ncbi:MAG: ankyrin repeat domain-containing protein [Deltaproteobacteria bacterium]|nr:ankyrin repeat domain-containing protein [Deltaproteobacteria bacterium]